MSRALGSLPANGIPGQDEMHDISSRTLFHDRLSYLGVVHMNIGMSYNVGYYLEYINF